MGAVSASGSAVERIALHGLLFFPIEGAVDVIFLDGKAVHEVESVLVVDESVSVVIHICLSVDLCLILPSCFL